MKFEKYPSIENIYRQEFIDRIIRENKASGVWVVTEKIHGTNFSFWYDGTVLRMAKRSCWIADDSNFYGVQNIKEKLIEKIKEMFNQMKRNNLVSEYIAVFGEIYGGIYPHPDIVENLDARKVQRGVYYCPHNDFFVYDIKVDGQFVDFDIMQQYCAVVGLRFSWALFQGSFAECLEYRNDFESTIYEGYGLPKIEDNICEGIVIRPNKATFLSSGKRVILKSKNERFKEKEHTPHKKVKIEDLPEEGQIALNEMISMITVNRYDNVVSKIGEVSSKDFGKLQGMLMKDILEELMGNTKVYFDYNNLEKLEKKMINKMVGTEVAVLIREKLLMGK